MSAQMPNEKKKTYDELLRAIYQIHPRAYDVKIEEEAIAAVQAILNQVREGRRGNFTVIDLLNGVQTHSNRPLLNVAIGCASLAMVELLLKEGADPNSIKIPPPITDVMIADGLLPLLGGLAIHKKLVKNDSDAQQLTKQIDRRLAILRTLVLVGVEFDLTQLLPEFSLEFIKPQIIETINSAINERQVYAFAPAEFQRRLDEAAQGQVTGIAGIFKQYIKPSNVMVDTKTSAEDKSTPSKKIRQS